MQLNTVSPEEMRTMLYLSKERNKRFVNSYVVFETVRSEINRLLGDPTAFEKNDRMVHQARVNAWIFDRIFNGAWEYTNPDRVEDEQDFRHSDQYFAPRKTNRTPVEPKKSLSDIFSRAKDILLTDVDSRFVSNVLGDPMKPVIVKTEEDEWLSNHSKVDATESGWSPKNRPNDTWGPSIAIYGLSKKILLANEIYCREMDTNPKELEELVLAGRFHELIDSQYHPKLSELVTKLSQGKSYKDEVLRSSRTGKLIAWNSIWNPESGSIRIGRDVTHGENRSLHSTGAHGFHLRGEETIAKMRQEALSRIDKMDNRGLDKSDMQEFALKRISIDTKLRVLLACGSSLDQFWKNGPFLMNIIRGDKIFGNGNYVNLTWIPGEALLSDLYSPEQIERIKRKFEEGRTKGHYESEFIMQLKAGGKIALPWHRFFPNPDKTYLGNSISFGIGTTAITDR